MSTFDGRTVGNSGFRSTVAAPRYSGGRSFSAWLLVGLLVILPLPLGSVGPIYWAMSGVIVGCVGAWHFWQLSTNKQTFRANTSELQFLTGLIAAMLAVLLVQVLPFFPTAATNVVGSVIELSQISVAPGQTILMMISVTTLAATFLLMSQFGANDVRRDRMYFALLLAITFYGLFGIVALQSGDRILGLTKWAYFGSATGPFVNRNSFATYLALGSVIAAGLIAGHLQRRFERHPLDGKVPNNTSNIIILSVLYLLLMVALFLTNSRMGLFVALLGTAVVSLLTSRVVGMSRAILLPGVAGALALLGGGLLFGTGTLERLQGVEGDSELRADLYRQVWDLIWQRPLTGFGGGAFEYAFELVRHPPVSVGVVWDRAHSTYLGLWSELGLVAGSIPMIAIGYVAWCLLAAALRTKRNLSAHAIGLAAIAVAAIHSIVDFSLEIFSVAMLFAAITGMAFGSYWQLPPDRKV